MGDKLTLNVGIICGGMSAEHEVSLQSAKNIYDAIDRKRFYPLIVGIDKLGRWFLPNDDKDGYPAIQHAEDPRHIHLNRAGTTMAVLPGRPGGLIDQRGMKYLIDVFFPILHGPFGEDGTVQGLLRLAGVPFVGAGVLGSALGMDKDMLKRVLRDAGLPIGRFRALRSWEEAPAFDRLQGELGLPFFVKPANMGSSVGIRKVHHEAEYRPALEEAFRYDTKVIIEEYIPGREIECSVLGNENPQASLPGEIRSTHEFYSYEAKYLDESGAALDIPANLPEETIREVQRLAIETFRVLSCEGMGRVDFFLKDDGRVIINEINTLPGFTRISMYPKLWEASGLSSTALISRLIDLALERFERDKQLKTRFF
jgi:D-alanine-D-alanine ligase